MKKLGFRIKEIDKTDVKTLKLPQETIERLGLNKKGSHPNDYIKDYLSDKKLFNSLNDQFGKIAHSTLPERVKRECQWCNGDSENEESKRCTPYYLEADFNYYMAAVEFVNIVEKNRHLLNTAEVRKKMALVFFQCFAFYEGRVIFDLEKITLYCLKQGFMTLSKMFAENSPLQSLSIINEVMHTIETQELEHELDRLEKPVYLDLEKKFYKKEKKYLKEKLKLEKHKAQEKKKVEFEPNKYEKIFTNDLGYTLFLKMHNFYKTDKGRDNANYSFLYYALDKEKLLVCKGVTFIDFAITEFGVKDYYKNESRHKEDYNRNRLFQATLKQLKGITIK